MTDSEQPYLLIAEDDELNQCIYTEQLSNDYEVKIVQNGKECLAALEERTPDVLILDIHMPELHGYEVCQIIRQNPKYKSLAIIFVSAFASEEEQQTGLKIGANDFLTKPYQEQDLLSIIKKHL